MLIFELPQNGIILRSDSVDGYTQRLGCGLTLRKTCSTGMTSFVHGYGGLSYRWVLGIFQMFADAILVMKGSAKRGFQYFVILKVIP
jgi:hypothetical protein